MKILAVFAMITLMSQCNKYDNTIEAKKLKVPDYTETGANTFGCLVNGAPWANFGETFIKQAEGFGQGHLDSNKVRSSVFYDSNAKDSALYITGTLTVSKQGHDLREEFMTLYIPKNGNLKGVHNDATLGYQNLLTYYSYGTYPPHRFTVIIKKDSIQSNRHIVSGTFNGMVYNAQRADSIRIVGGVFDTTLQP
jgi:hypothetical protein